MDSKNSGNGENNVISSDSGKLGLVLNNIVKISIAVGVLLISLSIAYYFIFFLPFREKAKIEDTKMNEIQRQLDLDNCLSDAQINYNNLWNVNCKGKMLKKDCALHLELADSIEKSYKDEKGDCFRKFPQK